MNSRINTKIDSFIQTYFSDIDFEFQGGSVKKADQQIWGLKYEYFVNAFEVYNYRKEIDVEDTKRLSTGHLQGIDSIYLILNNKFFAIPEENDEDYIDFVSEINTRLEDDRIEATFHFNQVKSAGIKQAVFVSFCDAVYDVFDIENKEIAKNNRIKVLRNTFEKIAAKTEDISVELMLCCINKDVKKVNELFVEWAGTIAKKKTEIASNNFKKVNISFKSGQEYINKLNSYNSPNKRTIEISDLKSRFIEHSVEDTKTYFGFLSIKEVVDILKDDDGAFDDRGVFFDNIRYFQGDTFVNSKILKSLNHRGSVFHALHNGIIITSPSSQYNMANGNLILSGFSIVNGCQTCNMIWKWYEEHFARNATALNEYKIPLKIVITYDYELRNQITEAANTQNPIKSINLIAISDSAKTLEKKFAELSWKKRKEKLVFQRLPYADDDVKKYLTVSLEDIARAFYSVFFKQPHEVSRSFGKYLETKLNAEDFLSDREEKAYSNNCYLVAAVASNYLSRFIQSKFVSLISLKNHLLLLLFIHISGNIAELSPKTIKEQLVRQVLDLVDDKDEFEKVCAYICDFTREQLTFFIDNSDITKPRVKPKSYYSEENTRRMIDLFIEHRRNSGQ